MINEREKEWIDRFLSHLQFERRLSPLTCRSYSRDLDALTAWCNEAGLETWERVDSEHIRAFTSRGFRNGLSPKSLQRRLSAARTFYRYMMREKHVSKNPVDDVRAPRGARRLPDNLDADRMARLLAIPGKGALVSRDRAMLELFYSSGLRVSELADLEWPALDLTAGIVRVTDGVLDGLTRSTGMAAIYGGPMR